MAKKSERLGAVLATYLVGLLIGGLYVGMVSPARTVIQADFGIDSATGIWMINIYTLFYAALIPVIGKVADTVGRRRVFAVCVCTFCVGACLCGVSQTLGGFGLLLVGRVVQAAGAGGMIPVANAAIGTSFPPEKRGMALGLAAAVMGVSNVFGAAAGSAVVGLFGPERWSAMFFLCIPFCALLAIAAVTVLPDDRPARDGDAERKPMDVAGSVLFVAFVLLLLLGVKGIDSAVPAASLARPTTWVPLVGALAVLPLFRFVEHRAASPVFHLEYFHNRPIVITMIVSFFIGCFVISLVLVPELAEFALDDPLGSGGYYVMAIGLTSFVTTPIGGKVIDKVGPKPVLMSGLAISIGGLLFLAFAVMAEPSPAGLIVGLAIVGAGMGFAMGAPTNYMILENTSKEESTSAIATITLIRQIGTSIAPALFISVIGAVATMEGYRNMLLCVAFFNACALVAMLFYRSPR
jgi:MFS family permease